MSHEPVTECRNGTRCRSTCRDRIYHCLDRIVTYGYLSALSRPEQVMYLFRQVLAIAVVSKVILSQRTADYKSWVEVFGIPRVAIKFAPPAI